MEVIFVVLLSVLICMGIYLLMAVNQIATISSRRFDFIDDNIAKIKDGIRNTHIRIDIITTAWHNIIAEIQRVEMSLLNKMKPITIDYRSEGALFNYKQHLKDDMNHMYCGDELEFNIETYYKQHNDNISNVDKGACWNALAYLSTKQRGFIRVRPEQEGNCLPHKITMLIQNGPIGVVGYHGIQVTDMIEYCGHILEILNKKHPCLENRESLRLISLVLEQQALRTKRRTMQGIEGKDQEINND